MADHVGHPDDLRPIDGECSTFVEVITEYMLRAGYDENADFEFGLGLILDGLERARGSARQA